MEKSFRFESARAIAQVHDHSNFDPVNDQIFGTLGGSEDAKFDASLDISKDSVVRGSTHIFRDLIVGEKDKPWVGDDDFYITMTDMSDTNGAEGMEFMRVHLYAETFIGGPLSVDDLVNFGDRLVVRNDARVHSQLSVGRSLYVDDFTVGSRDIFSNTTMPLAMDEVRNHYYEPKQVSESGPPNYQDLANIYNVMQNRTGEISPVSLHAQTYISQSHSVDDPVDFDSSLNVKHEVVLESATGYA